MTKKSMTIANLINKLITLNCDLHLIWKIWLRRCFWIRKMFINQTRLETWHPFEATAYRHLWIILKSFERVTTKHVITNFFTINKRITHPYWQILNFWRSLLIDFYDLVVKWISNVDVGKSIEWNDLILLT